MQLNDQIVLFLTIQFKCQSSIWLFQVLLLWARVDLVAMAMKGYFMFPKTQALLEP